MPVCLFLLGVHVFRYMSVRHVLKPMHGKFVLRRVLGHEPRHRLQLRPDRQLPETLLELGDELNHSNFSSFFLPLHMAIFCYRIYIVGQNLKVLQMTSRFFFWSIEV